MSSYSSNPEMKAWQTVLLQTDAFWWDRGQYILLMVTMPTVSHQVCVVGTNAILVTCTLRVLFEGQGREEAALATSEIQAPRIVGPAWREVSLTHLEMHGSERSLTKPLLSMLMKRGTTLNRGQHRPIPFTKAAPRKTYRTASHVI